jgi:acyl-coenzyme A synthetase/AMP-(fatty) acid ligase
MHPRQVSFVDELPLIGTNKIDRAALRVMAEQLKRERIGG